MSTRTRTSRASPKRRASPTTLYVRGFETGIVADIKRRAGSRGLTNAQYITRLVRLHAVVLAADQNPQMQEVIDTLGLGRVEA